MTKKRKKIRLRIHTGKPDCMGTYGKPGLSECHQCPGEHSMYCMWLTPPRKKKRERLPRGYMRDSNGDLVKIPTLGL